MFKKLLISGIVLLSLSAPANAMSFQRLKLETMQQPAFKPKDIKEAMLLNNAIYTVASARNDSGFYTGPKLVNQANSDMTAMIKKTAQVYAILYQNGLLEGKSLGRSVDISLYIAEYSSVATKINFDFLKK